MQYVHLAILLFFLLLRNDATIVKTSATAKATAMMTIIASEALNPGLIETPPVFLLASVRINFIRGLAGRFSLLLDQCILRRLQRSSLVVMPSTIENVCAALKE
jgi:hypothetical protein